LAGAKDLSFPQNVKTGSGAHWPSVRWVLDLFSGDKDAGA